MKQNKLEHEEMKTNLNDIIFVMTKELKKVDDTLDDPDNILYEINNFILQILEFHLSLFQYLNRYFLSFVRIAL